MPSPDASTRTLILLLALSFYVWVFAPQSPSQTARRAKLHLGHLGDPEVKAAAAEADSLLVDFYGHNRGLRALSCLCYLVA